MSAEGRGLAAAGAYVPRQRLPTSEQRAVWDTVRAPGIEEVAVPAASRVYVRRRERLGLNSLRPWDLNVDPLSRPPLRPFQDVEILKSKTST